MATRLKLISKIDWSYVLRSLGAGQKKSAADVMNQSEYQSLSDSSYNFTNNFWQEYHYTKDYDFTINQCFSALTNLFFLDSWITRVDPGRNIPYHNCQLSNRYDLGSYRNLFQLTCFIDAPRWGSAFIIEDQLFYNMPLGSIVAWESGDSSYASTVAGVTPQYLYHFIGYN